MRDFADNVGKFVDILKIPIDRGKTDVSHLVQMFQFGHHHFADFFGADLALAQREQLFHDAGDRQINRLGADRTLAQRQPETGREFFPVEFDTRAILLDHLRQADFGPLTGRKTLVTAQAAATAANDIAVVVDARIGDGRFSRATERAFHGLKMSMRRL